MTLLMCKSNPLWPN